MATLYLASADDAADLGHCIGRYRDWRGVGGATDTELATEIHRAIAQGNSGFLVAGRPPQGFVHYKYHRSVMLQGDICMVEILFVDAEHREQGLGKMLLRELESRCRKRGIKSIELHASATNRSAVRLYEDAGYSSHNPVHDGPDLYFRKPLTTDHI